MDIVAFLTARLDEDEQAAREAKYSSAGAVWLFEGPPSDGKSRPGRLKLGDGPWLVSDPELRAPTFGDNFDGHQMEHIARHDPAHVLTDVAAKRRILELHNVDGAHECPELSKAWGSVTGYETECVTLRLLALPYADRPEYQDRWRL